MRQGKKRKQTMVVLVAALLLLFAVKTEANAESVVLKQPEILYQTGATETEVSVRFTGDYGYTDYEVQMSPVNNGGWQNAKETFSFGKQAVVSGLEPGKTYFFRMRSHIQNTEQVSGYTKPLKVVTLPGALSSSPVQTGIKSTSATMKWGSAKGAKGYEILCADAPNKKFKVKGDTKSKSFKIKGLQKGHSYYAVVRPFTIMNEGTKNQAKAYGRYTALETANDVKVKTLPSAVKGLKNSRWKTNSKELTVSWKENETADGYELVFYNSRDKKVKTADVKAGASKTRSYVYKKAGSNTFCKVKIRAYVKVNGKKYRSDYTKPIYCLSQPAFDMSGGAVKQDDGVLEFSWKAVKGATGYDVYLSTSPKKTSFKKVKSVDQYTTSYTTDSFRGKRISLDNTYFMYVAAKKKAGSKTYRSVISSFGVVGY